jgi:ATP/maltotriose-dependent transcriptional regulator MalT
MTCQWHCQRQVFFHTLDSSFTVGNHLRNIYAKIGKNTRGEAVHWTLSYGLVLVE